MITYQICPQCKGSGKRGVFAMRVNGECNFEHLDCVDCGGTGRVDDQYEARITAGRLIREDRVNRGVSLREEAKRLGIGVVELSDSERGVKP